MSPQNDRVSWWVIVIAVLVVVLLSSGCATTEELVLRAARRDFPGCDLKFDGTWEGETVVKACGVPVTYEVTPLEVRRVR